MANLLRVECGECGTVFRLAARRVREARAGVWCPVCIAPATPDGALTDAQRANVQAAVLAVLERALPTLNAPRERERDGLKRRAEAQRKALKRVCR